MSAVKNKTDGLTMSDVDRALYNSMYQRFSLGLFDPPTAYNWPTANDVGSSKSHALSKLASQRSLVLLQNDEHAADALLPLKTGKRIAVLGPHSNAQKVLVQPYPFSPFCPNHTTCMASPFDAISSLNGESFTTTSQGCDLFNTSQGAKIV